MLTVPPGDKVARRLVVRELACMLLMQVRRKGFGVLFFLIP
jgi:hypothetical protein